MASLRSAALGMRTGGPLAFRSTSFSPSPAPSLRSARTISTAALQNNARPRISQSRTALPLRHAVGPTRQFSAESLNPVAFLSDLLLACPTPSYALSIIVLTVALRSGITVPFALWQRKRMKRLREKIIPEMKRVNDVLAVKVAAESRAQGMGYDEYKKELKKQMAEHQAALHKKYGTHPTITLLAPLAVNIPILVITSMAIRHALEVPDSALAADSWLWIPKLGEADPQKILPILGGLLAFGNGDMASRRHSGAKQADDAAIAPTEPSREDMEGEVRRSSSSSTSSSAATATATASAGPAAQQPRPRVAVPDSQLSPHLRRRLSTTAIVAAAPPRRRRTNTPQPQDKAQSQIPRTRTPPPRPALEGKPNEMEMQRMAQNIQTGLLSTVMRMWGILFIPFAAIMPSALVLYWTTSIGYSLAQNLVFGRIDARDRAARDLARARMKEAGAAAAAGGKQA